MPLTLISRRCVVFAAWLTVTVFNAVLLLASETSVGAVAAFAPLVGASAAGVG